MTVTWIALCMLVPMVFLGFLALRAMDGFYRRYRDTFVEQARFNLTDMFLFIDIRRLYQLNAVMVVVIFVLAWLFTSNMVVASLCLLGALFLPRIVYKKLRQRRLDRLQQQLPDSLLMLSASLKAGLGFGPAMENVVKECEPPLGQELALVLREQRMGVKLDDALGHLADRVAVQDVALFVAAARIAREVGGNLADSLALLSDTLRRRLTMEGKIRSLTSQGRLQGIVMAMLPVGITAFLSITYPETMNGLYHTPLGWGILVVCAVMGYIGYRVCRKIVDIDV
ncbi:type II secretion protein F [Dyella solisilvae]|uniref:Type II secretion protein F n=1 Tax=Dyella solisilvae TaxID=1920168 RepID=A0A370K7A9_9GAMM|nr:type II secretion system F family protein [Dyella solisilvae]RDI98526.1 type II secretion protein F [Dyella solisilvae]